MSFNKILIAVDESAFAARAVDVGFDLARSLGAQVALIYVVDPSIVAYAPESGIPASELVAEAQRDARRLIAAFTQRAALQPPPLEFIHTGKPLSFVYDIADLFKFETVVPLAFRIAAKSPPQPEREVRLACRDVFRSSKLLARIIPSIEEVLAAGGISPPEAPPESVPPAIPNPESIGDAGHRTQ